MKREVDTKLHVTIKKKKSDMRKLSSSLSRDILGQIYV